MQAVLGTMDRGIGRYNMIQSGDKIAVGLSGGKDSMVLLEGLYRLGKYTKTPFSLSAITIDPCFNGVWGDYSETEKYCKERNIPYKIIRTELADLIFNKRKEKNPCSLCARIRRGMLYSTAAESGWNKLALGHHQDDAAETLVMNLFQEGRIGCFQPVTYLSRKDITMIRPMILLTEKRIQQAFFREKLPLVESQCPVDKKTSREDMKNLLINLEKNGYPVLRKNLFNALEKSDLQGWKEKS